MIDMMGIRTKNIGILKAFSELIKRVSILTVCCKENTIKQICTLFSWTINPSIHPNIHPLSHQSIHPSTHPSIWMDGCRSGLMDGCVSRHLSDTLHSPF